MELARLADLAAARLKIAIEYDPTALATTVTLRHDQPLDEAGLWIILNRQLALKGLTTIIASGGSAYSIVTLQNAVSMARIEDTAVTPTAGTRADVPAGYLRIRYRPRILKAEAIAEAIRPMLSKPGGSVELLGTSDSLIISDFTPRLAEVRTFLDSIDHPSERISLERIELRYLSGAQASALAMQLALKREAAGAPKLRGEVLAASEARAAILLAPESTLPIWRELIEQIDRLESVETRVYATPDHPARDVAPLIDSTLKSDSLRDPRFSTIIDPLTESLIITATASQHAQIEGILARLADSTS